MFRFNIRSAVLGSALMLFPAHGASAQQPGAVVAGAVVLDWQQVQDRFRASNPTLRAGELNIGESRAIEITAHLRPNPGLYMGLDQVSIFHSNPYQPLAYSYPNVTLTYLHEREHKRELRTDSAKQGTAIAISNEVNLARTLNYTLRAAFVATMQAKATLALTKANLDYYDHVLDVSRDRFKAGDIAQVDLDRIELGRVPYESDNEIADVNLRTAKIQLLQLLNDRTPVDQFDITGNFDFTDALMPLDAYHLRAQSARPDLRAALETVEQAKINHRLAIANGSTDPIFGVDAAHQPNPLYSYIGVSMSIPLRIFDRNQGEKARTLIDIDLQQRQAEAVQAQVFADVDASYATVASQLNLLKPYKGRYLQLALSVRDTIAFSYQHGGASLLDFLQSESDYRGIQLGYINLVGSYLTAAAQMNEAVGEEVLP